MGILSFQFKINFLFFFGGSFEFSQAEFEENLKNSHNFTKNRVLEAFSHLKAKFIKEKDHKKEFILNQSLIFKLISMVYLEGLKKIRKHEKTDDFRVLIYEFFVKRYVYSK